MTTTTTKPGRVYGKQSMEERVSERKKQLVQAGIDVFGTVGYKSAKIKDLCQSAGLTERYFYESYSSKSQLAIDAYEKSFEALYDTIVNTISNSECSNFEELLEVGVGGFFNWCHDNPKQAKLVFIEVHGISSEVDEHYMNATQKFADYIVSIAKLVNRSEPYSKEDNEILGVGVFGCLSQMATYWIMKDYNQPMELLVNNGVRLMKSLNNKWLLDSEQAAE